MSESIVLIITSGIAGVFIKALFDYLTALLSAKSREGRSAELVHEYLRIADVTAEQLQERINYISTLDLENRKLHREIDELKSHRTDRDEQIAALEAGIAALRVQIGKDEIERKSLMQKYEILLGKYERLKQILREAMKAGGLKVAEMPDDLLDTLDGIKAVK